MERSDLPPEFIWLIVGIAKSNVRNESVSATRQLWAVLSNDPVFETEVGCRKLIRLMTRAGWPG